MPGPHRLRRRIDLRAAVLREGAAGAEAASGWDVERRGDVAADRRLAAPPFGHRLRVCCEERRCVGVLRALEHRLDRPLLDHAAEVHDRHVVGDVRDHRQLVGDEDHRQAEPLGQVDEQVEDLRLDRDVEGADGLVCDQKLGLRGEAACDRDPLSLAAAQLAREPARHLGRQADQVEQLRDARASVGAGGDAVHEQRLGDRGADGQPRVQRAERILEDHLDPPAHALQVLSRRARGRSTPSKTIEPSSGSTRRVRQRARVVLPLPDSPTIPSVAVPVERRARRGRRP